MDETSECELNRSVAVAFHDHEIEVVGMLLDQIYVVGTSTERVWGRSARMLRRVSCVSGCPG